MDLRDLRDNILFHQKSKDRFKKNNSIIKFLDITKKHKAHMHLIDDYSRKLLFNHIGYNIGSGCRDVWKYILTEMFLRLEYYNIFTFSRKKCKHYNVSHKSVNNFLKKMCEFGYFIKINKSNYLATKKYYRDYYSIWNLCLDNKAYIKYNNLIYNIRYKPKNMINLFYDRNKTLRNYNNLLSKHSFSIVDNNTNTSFNPVYNCVLNSKKGIVGGGRFYNPFITNAQRDIRSMIKINNNKTIEIDIVSCHANILSSLSGNSTGDFYNSNYYDREKFKMAFLIATGSKSKKMAKKHLLDRGYDIEIMSALEEKFGNNLWNSKWIELQMHESDWLSDVINECASRNIPILTVHDSVISQSDCFESLSEIMKKNWENRFNSEIILKSNNEEN